MIDYNEINNLAFNALNGVVYRGPFEGMRMGRWQPWNDGNLGPKLFGTYEMYLRPWLYKAADKHPPRIINVGIAEGYYAVGMARLCPDAEIIAMDIDPYCLMVTAENAKMNNVSVRCASVEEATPGVLNAFIEPKTLIIMDVEGYELKYLDPDMVPNLIHADVIVECHNFLAANVTEIITQRLKRTHALSILKNPKPYPAFGRFRNFTDAQYKAVVTEVRNNDSTNFIYAVALNA